MTIAVLGTGRMGTALARAFLRAGHQVILASRDSDRAKSRTASEAPGATAATPAEAVLRADAAVLAVLWEDVPEMLAAAGDFAGKVLIDATNPEATEGRALVVGHTTSGAEEVARLATGARVVKAFNHVYAEILDRGPAFGGERATAFLCGDDESARRTVSAIAAGCGFAPVDAGGLESARYLEPAAMLMVELVRGRGEGAGSVALHLLARAGENGVGGS